MSITGNLGLYVHIPFCTKKCPYCNFYVIPFTDKHEFLLSQALLKELDWRRKELSSYKVDSLYFGGGTPSLSPKIISSFIQRVKKDLPTDPNIEITVEANPETLTEKTLQTLTASGVNRLSIGVQSFQRRSLIELGRTHSKEKALSSIHLAEKYIKNISIDLMFDLPDENIESLKKSLEYLPELPISHISIYNLTIEPHTSFYKRRDQLRQPSPNSSAKNMEYLFSYLEELSFKRYEISAFCKEEKYSRHNCKYWKNEDVLGFGPSATSFLQNKRSKTYSNIMRYISRLEKGESIFEYEEILPDEKGKRLELCLALRLLEGVDIKDYPTYLQTEIDSLVKKELLQKKGNRVRLSEKGVYFHDLVCEELI